MGNWGIAETAPTEEKIKANFFDVLNGLNSTGAIDYTVYSQLFDEFEKVAEELTQLKAEKSGEWVITVKKGNNYQWYTTCHCSECEEIYENAQNHHSETDRVYKGFFPNVPEDIIHSVLITNTKSMKLKSYCPNCGAKMKEGD